MICGRGSPLWRNSSSACEAENFDHSFDDNADDSCAPNYAHSTEFRPRNSLYTVAAHSWQCGVTDIESLASTDVRT